MSKPMSPTNLYDSDPDVALGIRMWAHYDATLRMTGDARIAYSTLGVAVRAHALDAQPAPAKGPVFAGFDFKNCMISPEEENRIRQQGRYLTESEHLDFWQLGDRLYVLPSRVNPKPAPAAQACDYAEVDRIASLGTARSMGLMPEALPATTVEQEAETLSKAFDDNGSSWPKPQIPFCDWTRSAQAAWLRVATRARSLRSPAAAKGDGASVVVDRKEWERIRVVDQKYKTWLVTHEADVMFDAVAAERDAAKRDRDRLESERDSLRGEVERLQTLVHETAAAWLGADLDIPFEGAIDGAMRTATNEIRSLRADVSRLTRELEEAKKDNERLRFEAPPRICECGHPDSRHGFYAGSHPTSCASGCPCKKFTLRAPAKRNGRAK